MKFDEELESLMQPILVNIESSFTYTKTHYSTYMNKENLENYYRRKKEFVRMKVYEIKNYYDPKKIFLQMRDDH